MLLALDLGNTVLKAGLISENGIILKKMKYLHKKKGVSFLKFLNKTKWPRGITEIRLASVVPDLTEKIARVLESCIGVRVKTITSTELPIKVRLPHPEEAGIDRVLNALAAGRLYGKPAVVVDCGTALTLDLVTEDGDYAGGIIAPSPEISRDYLFEKTALLPRVKLIPPPSVVGKNTDESLRAGLIFGLADLVSGLLVRLRKEWKPEFTVVGTGGGLVVLRPYLAEEIIFDRDLTLKGIYLTTVNGKCFSQG